MNSDLIDLFQNTKAKCDYCGSLKLLLFTETRIKDCVAWGCFDCKHFEISAKPESLKEYFEKKNDTKRLS